MIPASLRQKVLRVFGPPAGQWLENLPGLLDACIQKWNLHDCSPSPIMSHNMICFASSPEFGDVVLKIGFPHRELYTEKDALALFSGRNICQIFAWDESLGAMLLERISPGRDLTTLNNKDQRVSAAAILAAELPVQVPESHNFPLFSELISRAFKRQRQEGAYPEMLQYMDAAQQAYARLSAGRPQVLLHGDLNHWNILSHNGQWKAIDPKGIIGPACMEPARFMQNQLRISSWQELHELAAAMGAAIGEPPSVAIDAVFVDTVLGTCWSMEEHQQKDRSSDVALCGFLHQALST